MTIIGGYKRNRHTLDEQRSVEEVQAMRKLQARLISPSCSVGGVDLERGGMRCRVDDISGCVEGDG